MLFFKVGINNNLSNRKSIYNNRGDLVFAAAHEFHINQNCEITQLLFRSMSQFTKRVVIFGCPAILNSNKIRVIQSGDHPLHQQIKSSILSSRDLSKKLETGLFQSFPLLAPHQPPNKGCFKR